MANLLSRLVRRAAPAAPDTKAAPAPGIGITFYGEGRASWTPRDIGALAREGFQRNAIVHRAVRLVAEAAASLPLGLVGDTDAAPHPLEALLARPNPREGGARLLESLYGHLMV